MAASNHRFVKNWGFLKEAKQRYATVELECLAITWGILECQQHLLGCPEPFTVVTDHRLLLGIFSKDLPSLKNTRLQRLRQKVMDYQFQVTWAPGKWHLIADALSHTPVFAPPEEADEEIAECFAIGANLAVHNKIVPHIDDSYIAVRQALQEDVRLAKLPPNHPAKIFKHVWHQLSTDGTLILMGDRIVIPSLAQKQIVDMLHIPHNSIVKNLQSARQLYYWPLMTRDITVSVEQCDVCQRIRPSQCHEKLQPSQASFPMEMVSADIFESSKQHYQVMVDQFSGYPWVHQLHHLHTDAITSKMLRWFQEYGFLLSIRTDGGPQFQQEFQEFCKMHSIVQELASPHNAQSNGHVKAAVKNMKYVLSKCGNFGKEFQRCLCE